MTIPGMGGQQQPPQNASPAGQLVPGVQPGVSGQIVARRVIIIGTGGELLVYSPAQGAGNLATSVAGAAFVDTFGNAVLAGTTSYSQISPGIWIAASLTGSGVSWFNASSEAGPWTFVAQIVSGSTGSLSITTAGVAGSIPRAAVAGFPIPGAATLATVITDVNAFYNAVVAAAIIHP